NATRSPSASAAISRTMAMFTGSSRKRETARRVSRRASADPSERGWGGGGGHLHHLAVAGGHAVPRLGDEYRGLAHRARVALAHLVRHRCLALLRGQRLAATRNLAVGALDDEHFGLTLRAAQTASYGNRHVRQDTETTS